jgi:hypothetical protein
MNTTELIRISSIKFDGHKIDLSTNAKGKPVARLHKLLTAGKNKGTYKLLSGYYFSDEQRREHWIKEQMNSIKARIADNEARKQTKSEAITGHPFKVGDSLYQSWGYDQTNIDFYEVVEVLPKSVKVRPISQLLVEGSEGFMCENVKPDIGNYTGEAELKQVRAFVSYEGNTKSLKVTGYYISNGRHHLSLYTYGDRGVYQSHYA